MIKKWIAKMQWNDKACLIGMLIFGLVCQSERLYLRMKSNNQKTTETETPDSE